MINDKATGLFNSFMSVGCCLGPIIGGVLNDLIGYRTTNDYIALLSTIFTITFLTFNMEVSDFKWFKRNVDQG